MGFKTLKEVQMKKYFLFFLFALIITGAPYKPYPIIFIHGLGSNSKCWGVKCDTFPDSLWYGDYTDSIVEIQSGHTYSHFLNYMIPIVVEWWKIDKSYTHPDSSPNFPNKTFLEVVNMDDPWGSIDDDYTGGAYYSLHYSSWQDELYHRVKEVLKEYYGDNWETNLDAKVILIGHSTGDIVNCKMKNERI